MRVKAARLNDQLCFALYSASNRLTAIYRPILEPLGLTYTQFVVMMALWEKDHVSMTEIANRTNLSKATMTPLLKKLESKQLITRQQVIDNERQKEVSLTHAGIKLASRSMKATEEAFCATGLAENQAQAIISLCQLIGNESLIDA